MAGYYVKYGGQLIPVAMLDGGYKGAWDSGTQYVAGDVVAHTLSTWGANTTPNVGDEPGVSGNWDELSASGGVAAYVQSTEPAIWSDNDFWTQTGTYADYVLASSSPQVFLSLDETGSPGTVADLSGNGYDATVQGTPTFEQAGLVVGGTSVFLDSTDFLEIPGAATSDLHLGGAVELVWTSPASLPSVEAALMVHEYTGGNLPMVIRYQNGNLYAAHYNGSWHNGAAFALSPSTRYHVVLNSDGSDFALYVDNVSVSTMTGQSPGSSANNFRVGRRWDQTSYIGGTYDAVGVYTSPLSTQEISDHYDAGIGTLPVVASPTLFQRIDGTAVELGGGGGGGGAAEKIFSATGYLSVASSPIPWYNDTDTAIQFSSVRASLKTAPSGAAVWIDINVDGASALGADYPLTVADGATSSGKVTLASPISVLAGSYVSIDVDQIGSSLPGETLLVQLTV